MRLAGELLLIEARALKPLLVDLTNQGFDRPTVCTGWSVRDVLGHCGAALSMTGAGELHGFSPAENESDVELRRGWTYQEVLDELFRGYESAAIAIDRAGGSLDGIGLGEWIHGGDVREAIGAPLPYISDGVDLAFRLLLERSAEKGAPRLEIHVDGVTDSFGPQGDAVGRLSTDLETFVRLCGGRHPAHNRLTLTGADPKDLVLFD